MDLQLLCLDARELHHLGPLLDFGGDEPPEQRGRMLLGWFSRDHSEMSAHKLFDTNVTKSLLRPTLGQHDAGAGRKSVGYGS